MKYLKHNQLGRIELGFLAISLTLIGGCAEWSSTPTRVQDDFGASVRNMVLQQTYNPAKAQSPTALAPDGIDSNKARTILDKAYRQDTGNPADISHSPLGTSGISGSGGSGGSAR
ncbi:MAG: hypothetical protein ACU83U_05990 [Gammaproteobacteria bacterium]